MWQWLIGPITTTNHKKHTGASRGCACPLRTGADQHTSVRPSRHRGSGARPLTVRLLGGGGGRAASVVTGAAGRGAGGCGEARPASDYAGTPNAAPRAALRCIETSACAVDDNSLFEGMIYIKRTRCCYNFQRRSGAHDTVVRHAANNS
jgi:hypothetical protein